MHVLHISPVYLYLVHISPISPKLLRLACVHFRQKMLTTPYHKHNRVFIFDFLSPPKGAGQQNQSRLIKCPPPRKSLVKGERFIRSEGRPEWNALVNEDSGLYVMEGCATLVGRHKRMWLLNLHTEAS